MKPPPSDDQFNILSYFEVESCMVTATGMGESCWFLTNLTKILQRWGRLSQFYSEHMNEHCINAVGIGMAIT